MTLLEKSDGGEKDVRLITKVLSSGHRSVIEHHVFTVAFENVSVLVEQFMIEHRLCSFTVKSRRYVDFSHGGFYLPAFEDSGIASAFKERIQGLFDTYEQLTQLGIPREDARFVLPYCFFSNFYATMNARELILIVRAMLYGRGATVPELRQLGLQLAEQLERIYPGIIGDGDAPTPLSNLAQPSPAMPHVVEGAADLLQEPDDPMRILRTALDFSRPQGFSLQSLVRDPRPRELEFLFYGFRIRNASLACVTHFARHRMTSPIFGTVTQSLRNGGYVLPDTVRRTARALELYQDCFVKHADAVSSLLQSGFPVEALGYLALSGHTMDFLFAANARELLHFIRLRTCRRAQWEIRSIAEQMKDRLIENAPELFSCYGPSCAVLGRCPEGRLSCGNPYPSIDVSHSQAACN